jgi:secreted PhoX family phosphatase
MRNIQKGSLSWDDWDETRSPRPEQNDFDRVVEEALSRRGFLGGALAFGSGAAVMGTLLSSSSARASAHSGRFAFEPIAAKTDFTVHVPSGYKWSTLVRYGDPLFSDAPEFSQTAAFAPDAAARVFGENTDGMELFEIDGHEVIAVNHEYVNPEVNLPENAEGATTSADNVKTLQNLQGVAVFEVARGENGWGVVVDSPFNRRITHVTEIAISGPAAGHDLLKTEADPTGTKVLGTLNNCGAGKTPWGTYLTCEENFNGYFGSTDANFALPDDFKRYGIGLESGYDYEKFDPRFDISANPNEPYRFGYVVEIDPSDAASMPVKRTALGRFKHENAACTLAPDGRVVVYMGDDERGEYMYKYVSNGTYAPGKPTDGLLDDGKLYTAKFNWDGTGEWIELTPETTGGMSEAEIRVLTRVAATAAGATTMDRPEWIAVNPVAAEGYCALTNNSRRGALTDDGKVRTNAAGQEMTVNAPNPRALNEYGQVLRWYPANDDHGTTSFRWDLYVMAGNPVVGEGAYKGSPNVTEGNMFNSPDGMMFDSAGILWIQTDGDDSNAEGFAGMGNNQMLAGDPVSGEIARFLTGPNGSEVTGLTWSADRRTMFVGIQHPSSPFPDGEGTLARSSIVAVWRDDGALVG